MPRPPQRDNRAELKSQMDRPAQQGRPHRRKALVSLILFCTLFSLIGLSFWNTRKVEAQPAGQVYPEPTTLFTVPVPQGISRINSSPYAITVGPDGNLWFTDFADNFIGRSTPGGSITEYPLPTSTNPTAIAAGPDGNLWFVTRYSNGYGYITPSGKITEFSGGPYVADPKGLVAGPDGNLWFAAIGYIGRITPAGVMTVIPSPVGAPAGITVGPDGALWYAGGPGIGRTTTAGVSSSFNLNSPYTQAYGLTLGPDGNLWFTEQGGYGQDAIGRITPQGTITDYPLPYVHYPDNTSWPIAPSVITTGPDGNLWFNDNPDPLFGQITTGGAITIYLPPNASSFGGTTPESLVAGPDGNLWFSEDLSGQVGYLALGGSGGSTPTPVVPTPTPVPPTPTPTPTAPTTEELLLASNAAYGLDSDTFSAPPGMKELTSGLDVLDGFASVALEDSNNNIIIANEGSLDFKDSSKIFVINTGIADNIVREDKTPPALKDAIFFAGTILSEYYGKPDVAGIYVTGHSLGGIEAEAEAKAWGNIAGGATFGATGLPGNTTPGGPKELVNYVDYGDPVGNYASDGNAQLHDQPDGLMYHYGDVQFIGSPLNAANLQTAATSKLAMLTPYEGSSANRKPATNLAMLTLCLGTNFVASTDWHKIANYASDLQLQLPPSPGDDEIASENVIGLVYDEELGRAGVNNLNSTSEGNNGTVNSSDTTIQTNTASNQITIFEKANVKESWGTVAKGGKLVITVDPILDTITSVRYSSPDGSQYLMKFADTWNKRTGYVSMIQVNPVQGGSYQVAYDTTASQDWFSHVSIYNQPNERGRLQETIDNWTVGGSQVLIFVGLPRGKTVEIINYSGPNGTGKQLGPPQYK